MSGTVLDQDFGSESEDDNFNPAPADESDNEGEAKVNPKIAANGTERRRSSGGEKGSPSSPGEKVNGEDDDHGNGDVHGAGDEDEEDEEDEDDDEIIVRVHASAAISSR